jgi:hypothetical protein
MLWLSGVGALHRTNDFSIFRRLCGAGASRVTESTLQNNQFS